MSVHPQAINNFKEKQYMKCSCRGCSIEPPRKPVQRDHSWYDEALIKKAEHDYDPAWDYELAEEGDVPSNVIALTQSIVDRLKKELLPKLDEFSTFDVHWSANDTLGKLGIYIDGTSSAPVIVLDYGSIFKACTDYNAPLETAIETTILHELGHAIEEARELETDEDRAEQFARHYYDYGELNI